MAFPKIFYLDDRFLPVPKSEATIVKIRQRDGTIEFMQLPPKKTELSEKPGLLLRAIRYARQITNL